MTGSSADVQALMTGLAFGESPRWHDDRLWFSNWVAQEVIAVDLEGKSEVVVRVPFSSFPFSIDWLPDGRLLMVSTSDRPLLRREPDGSLVTHADLSAISRRGWNEIVVDGRGNAYINGVGFDMMGGEEFAPGIVALVTPDGSAPQRHGRDARQHDPDRRRVLREEAHGVRHLVGRRTLQPARVG